MSYSVLLLHGELYGETRERVRHETEESCRGRGGRAGARVAKAHALHDGAVALRVERDPWPPGPETAGYGRYAPRAPMQTRHRRPIYIGNR
jgi:hypothetical protein